ncbi:MULTISPECIES: hypothetical protein [Nostocales]|nr:MULTISPECIES: hypothetical protein [Nostocales]
MLPSLNTQKVNIPPRLNFLARLGAASRSVAIARMLYKKQLAT